MLDIFWVLVVPLILGLVLTTFRAVASQTPITNETAVDVALDMTFLALGASGSAFYNLKVQKLAGDYTMPILVTFIIGFLCIIARLLYVRRFATNTTKGQARKNLFLGVLACVMVAVVIYLGT